MSSTRTYRPGLAPQAGVEAIGDGDVLVQRKKGDERIIRLKQVDRACSALRHTFMKTGIVNTASGSSYIEMNNTKVICSVHGPRHVQKSVEFSEQGRLWCDIKYAPFSQQGARISSRQSDAERQNSRMLENALISSLRLETFPKATLEVYVIVLQDDGGALEAAITAASLAIADAGVDMFDLVSACAAGISDDVVLLDPSIVESDSNECVSRTSVAYMPGMKQVTLTHHSGNATSEAFKSMFEACVDGCSILNKMMRKVLLESAAATKQD